MSYKFGGMLYRNSREMHVAIAEEWLSAGGRNHRDDMFADLGRVTDGDLADDAIANWDANDQGGEDAEPSEHFDREELVAAFRSIRANFDAHFPLDAA
jgi:hypothetical protein